MIFNQEEAKSLNMNQRLTERYSSDRLPTPYQRFLLVVNNLFPYFKTLKILMTVFTPILILIWFAKNFNEIKKAKERGGSMMNDLQNNNVFYVMNTIDLNYYEASLVRFS